MQIGLERNATMLDAVVFGATGFIGRWTILHLLDQGRTVAAPVRDPSRADELRTWPHTHGADAGQLTVVAAHRIVASAGRGALAVAAGHGLGRTGRILRNMSLSLACFVGR
jgi:uncharacterized protein YbjT (DUF2867 family)